MTEQQYQLRRELLLVVTSKYVHDITIILDTVERIAKGFEEKYPRPDPEAYIVPVSTLPY